MRTDPDTTTRDGWPVAVIAVIGDPLSCLAPLRSTPEMETFHSVHSTGGSHRAVVIGVDIVGLRTTRQLRARLRDIALQCAVLCRRLAGLEHIFVIVNGSRTISEDTVHRICESTATRIHALLEQACARSIGITVLLAEHCEDHRSLADRIAARSRQGETLDPGIALRWKDIAHTPISTVAANSFL